MRSLISCCYPSQKYTIYISGSYSDKKVFCKKVFDLDLLDIAFSESMVRFNGTSLILLTIANEQEINEVHQMHIKRSNGVIFLRDTDEIVDKNCKSLFVRMNGKSQLESENNTIVRSVTLGSYEDAKDGVKSLIRLIKN